VRRFCLLMGLLFGLAGSLLQAEEHNVPPAGFEALFNGQDLSGWHGMGHFDPRKLAAMSDEERAQKREADMANVLEHWRVEDGESSTTGTVSI
jgi:hypothetical protein